jgi:DNA-binding beta-propeller fold protein YncE
MDRPVAVIRDPGLRYPHSVAFTPITNHLVVTNAGANYFRVYGHKRDGSNAGWTQMPVLHKAVGPESVFKKVNACNKMEGGPKGVAIHKNSLAVCSPGYGVMIYSFRETRPIGDVSPSELH